MEARIAGVNLPLNKQVDVALTEIFGVGRQTAIELCAKVGIQPSLVVKDMSEENLDALRIAIDFPVEGDLRRKIAMDIKRKIDIGCYQGIRHRRGLPLKQRTRTNARTRKGKRKSAK